MRQTRAVELGTGLFVLLGVAAIFFLTTQATGGDDFVAADTYEVTAYFDNVGSLKPRAPVAMAGVTIGRVTSIEFDPIALNAIVKFEISSEYNEIPEDAYPSILTAGLLGSQYIGLEPGGAEDYLADGSEIYDTQSAIVLENLIGKFLVNMGGDE